jgi:DNA replication licensing factor MCM4
MVEVLLYEGYLKRMRVTGEANLNLDCEDLHVFPQSRKLYGQLVKYPQEVLLTRYVPPYFYPCEEQDC